MKADAIGKGGPGKSPEHKRASKPSQTFVRQRGWSSFSAGHANGLYLSLCTKRGGKVTHESR